MMPMLDGIMNEVFRHSKRGGLPRTLLKEAQADEAVIRMVEVLWLDYDPVGRDAGSTRLNRHGILHGSSLDHGTRENSLRVIFALDQLTAVARAHLNDAVDAQGSGARDRIWAADRMPQESTP